MYSEIVKNQAFLLYCVGHSYDSIVDELKEFHKKSCKKLNRSTVRNWAVKRDWETKRKEQRKRFAVQEEKEASHLIRSSAEKIEEMIPSMLEEIKGMNFSSKEGGVYAVNTLLKSYREFTGENKPSIEVRGEEGVALFLEALNSVDEVKSVIEKYKSVIGERYEAFSKKKKSEKELLEIGDKDGNANRKSK